MVKTLRRRDKKNLPNKLSKRTRKVRGGGGGGSVMSDIDEGVEGYATFCSTIKKHILKSTEATYYVSFHSMDMSTKHQGLIGLYSCNERSDDPKTYDVVSLTDIIPNDEKNVVNYLSVGPARPARPSRPGPSASGLLKRQPAPSPTYIVISAFSINAYTGMLDREPNC